MTMGLITLSILQGIEKRNDLFWDIFWGLRLERHDVFQNLELRKMSKIIWRPLKYQKSDGDLDFLNLMCANKSLLIKLTWDHCLQLDSNSAQLMNAKYFKSCHLLEARIHSPASEIWWGIHPPSECLMKNSCWCAVNGEKIRIFKTKKYLQVLAAREPSPLDYLKNHC